MEGALDRIEKDRDLTMRFTNYDMNKCFNLCLPNLFKTSKGAVTRRYYERILEVTLDHLRRADPSTCLFGATNTLISVFETEPNVNKRIVTALYDELRHRTENQFEPLFADLSAKEDAIQALQESYQRFNGFDEAKEVAGSLAEY